MEFFKIKAKNEKEVLINKNNISYIFSNEKKDSVICFINDTDTVITSMSIEDLASILNYLKTL